MLKLSSTGRGTSFTRTRGLVESVLGVVYRRDWPARAWAQVPGRCDVRVIRRTLRVLPPGMPGVRVGYASDLHIGPTTPARLLENAADALARERIDVLLLGGDYVFLDASPRKANALRAFVERVGAPRTLAVLGNHDLWTDHRMLERSLEAAGAELLVNRSVRLAGARGELALVGLDDPWTGTADPERAFAAATSARARIVLCHSPEGLPLIRGRDVRLFVCGHTHGGHVAAPWGPIVVPGTIGKELSAGFYEHAGTQLFVSRGLGGIEVPVRSFARPDVAVLTLVTSKAG